jgi:hypothetical protein
MLLVMTQPVQAQDATVLVVALAPPILLAPVCLALVRWFWLRKRCHSPALILPLLVVSCIEVLLWVALMVVAVVFMTGDWNLRAVLPPAVACGALWMLSRIWFDPSHKAARWLYLASPPLALVLLASVTWLVLIVVWS